MPSPSWKSSALARSALILGLILLPPAARAQDAAGHQTHGAVVPVGASRAVVEIAISCPSACWDFDSCTLDSCDTTTGTCRFEPRSCDDGNPCTEVSCQPDRGCVSRPEPREGAACDDGNACTLQDACAAGTCRGGVRLVGGEACDDRNSCTIRDACSPAGTCQGVEQAAGQSCDDGDACTSDDRCVEPEPGGKTVCEGVARDCGDGDLCTEDRCDAATGLCSHPAVSCDDGNECTADACDPATGDCRREPAAGPCDDGNYCTLEETCAEGNCVGGQDRNCGQDDRCGDYYCDSSDRVCKVRLPDTLYPCGLPDQCSAGQCTGPGGFCQYYTLSGPCTGPRGSCSTWICMSGHCLPERFQTGWSCDDGNLCTTGDVCTQTPSSLGCFGTPVDCSDGRACTLDSCNGSTGTCEHADTPVAACDDHNACTTDSCDDTANTCRNAPLSGEACDDGDPCTEDACDPQAGCVHPPKACNDSDPCTTDLCAATTGTCVHAPIDCDDGNDCTREQCVGGVCVTDPYRCEDFNQCTIDTCLGTSCSHVPVAVGTPCYDGLPCTQEDACIADPVLGVKCVGIGPDCDDGNRCTLDVLGECVCGHLPVDDVCCSGGTARTCNDGNPCTADRCDLAAGCMHDPVSNPVTCGLGACQRTVDICAPQAGGKCVPGAPTQETCNGIDDDCDGVVDERDTMPLCAVRPVVMRDAGTLQAFSVMCRRTPACEGAPVEAIRTVWLSAADLLFSPADNVALPDPYASCESAIVENASKRMETDDAVTFLFDPSGNGICGTTGGGRPGLVRLLEPISDGTLARVCVKWRRADGVDVERCGIVVVRHDASTEPHPVTSPAP